MRPSFILYFSWNIFTKNRKGSMYATMYRATYSLNALLVCVTFLAVPRSVLSGCCLPTNKIFRCPNDACNGDNGLLGCTRTSTLCADGSVPNLFGGCADTSRPLLSKDRVHWKTGGCAPMGCNCEYDCKEGTFDQQSACSRPGAGTAQRLLKSNGTYEDMAAMNACVSEVTSKYQTGTLNTTEQIRDYYDCLNANGDGGLDMQDPVLQELESTMGEAALKETFGVMDGDGDAVIEPNEFDSDLGESTDAQVVSSESWRMRLPMMLIVSIIAYHACMLA